MSERRTRIKICGLTRAQDVDLAVALGADAVGFVLYPASPRYVTPAQLKQLVARLPAFVSSVGLFVNAPRATIRALLGEAPLTLLQFHGDESPADCAGFDIPYLRAIGVNARLDLVEFAQRHHAAKALLLDADTESYGGAGKTFDWSLIPQELGHRAVLSGGLNAQNVADAIARVRPFAVDVASGVERAKGIKDEGRMRAFFDAVRRADTLPEE